MKKTIFILLVTFLLPHNFYAQDFNSDIAKGKEYFKKAAVLKSQFKLDSALLFFRQASELFHKHEVWDNYLIIQNEIGNSFVQRGDIDKALEVYETYVPLAINKFGASNMHLANGFHNIGIAYFFAGKNTKAISYYEQSLAMRQSLGKANDPLTSNVYNDLGNAYTENSEYDKALKMFRKSLDMRIAFFGELHPAVAASYNSIGIIYKVKAEYDQALEYHKKAFNIQNKTVGASHPDIANYLQNIGNVYLSQSEYDLALQYYLQTLELRIRFYGKVHPLTAKDYLNIGIVYDAKDDLGEALANYSNAYKIQNKVLPKTHADKAMVLNNIGNIYNKQSQYENSIKFYLQALDIKSINYGRNHPEVADYFTNLGNAYSALKKYEIAVAYYDSALVINEVKFGTKHPAVVLPYLNLASTFYDMKDYYNALENYQKSLIANVKDFNPDFSNTYANPELKNYYDREKLLRSLEGKAKTLVGKYKAEKYIDDLKIAYKIYEISDSLIGITRNTTSSKADKIALGKITSRVYDQAIDVCFMLATEIPEAKKAYDYKAFYFSEKNKSGVLLEALASAEASKFAGIPDSLLIIEKELNKEINELEKQIAEVTDFSEENIFRAKLLKINEQYAHLVQDFEQNYPKYYEMKYNVENISAQKIIDILDSKTLIRTYFVGDSLISIFTLQNNGLTIDRMPLPIDYEYDIAMYRKNIRKFTNTAAKAFTKQAYSFHQNLFPPIESKSIENVIIIPDGLLGTIPFETFLTEKYTGNISNFREYPYLIKKYNISYSYSTNLLYKSLTENNPSPAPKDWLGLAPVFLQNKGDVIMNGVLVTPLPASEQEIDSIYANFTKNELSAIKELHSAANEEFVKSDILNDYKYLHIATHGFVNSERPELSGIFLAPQKGENDGILYSGEIYNLQLNSDLVVLSACETGLGKIVKGEGVIGLSRALLYAGTDNLIVSLWKVSDKSTSELMINFYNGLIEERKQNAQVHFSNPLRAAKLSLISQKTKLAHPYFWSPFILIGN